MMLTSKMFSVLLICGLNVFVSGNHLVTAHTLQDVQDLYDHMFNTTRYNNKIRPVIQQVNITWVYVTFYLSAIVKFDEQEECLTTAGYLSFTWKDEQLTWTPSSYGNASMIFVPQDDVWKPDISLRNSVTTPEMFGASYYYAWLYNDGTVFWEPFEVLKSTCSVDISYFPFDTQTCKLKFIAWSYSSIEVSLLSDTTLTSMPVGINYGDFSTNALWELVSSDVTNNTHDGSVTFYMKLQRKPGFYVVSVILPIIMLSVLNIMTFELPTSSGERAAFSISVFLSLAIFLTIVASELPKNSEKTSQLAIYLLINSAMSTFIAMFSVYELRLASRDIDSDQRASAEIGCMYRKLHAFAEILQCRKSNKIPRIRQLNVGPMLDIGEKMTAHSEFGECKLKWVDIVNALDFLMFWLCMFITVTSTIVYLGITVTNPQRVENQYAHVYENH